MSNATIHMTSHNVLRITVIAHSLHSGGGISVDHSMIAALGFVGLKHDYFISYPSGFEYEEVIASVPQNTCLD